MKDIIEGIGILILLVAVYFGLIFLFTKSVCMVFGITFTIWTAVFIAFVVAIFIAIVSIGCWVEDND